MYTGELNSIPLQKMHHELAHKRYRYLNHALTQQPVI